VLSRTGTATLISSVWPRRGAGESTPDSPHRVIPPIPGQSMWDLGWMLSLAKIVSRHGITMPFFVPSLIRIITFHSFTTYTIAS